MKFGTPTNKNFGERTRLVPPLRDGRRLVCRASAFTLAEVLAALMFMAIVIPVAVDAIRVASLSGEIAERKGEAARVAERVLNESMITTNWSQGTMSGTISEGARDFRWTLHNELWSRDSQAQMQLLTAEVKFSAQGKDDYTVRMSTLANSSSTVLTNGF